MDLGELSRLGFSAAMKGGKLVVKPASKITPEIRERIKKHRGEIVNELSASKPAVKTGATRKAPSRKPVEAVGSELAKLIPAWATSDTSGCSCKSWVKKMDRWGVSGCEANRDAIVNHLVKQKKYLVGPLRLVPDAVAKAGATKLLDKAIRLSGGD